LSAGAAQRGRYPPIGDYALIGDCRSAALVSHAGSIDWCCMPRIDHGSCFARILDWEVGGHCSIAAADVDVRTRRRYVDGTLVLETQFSGPDGEARLYDCFAAGDAAGAPSARLLRILEGVRGELDFELAVVPRFDYGALSPWLRRASGGTFTATGGDDGLVISCDGDLRAGKHDLRARIAIRTGERLRLSIAFVSPESLDAGSPPPPEDLDDALQRTVDWWQHWSSRGRFDGADGAAVIRSAIVLKALANPDTGAIAAAPTTSLPEAPGGALNWDYRFSWIRDSAFSVHALSELGFDTEADGFRRFVERSAAGNANGLQIMYGIGGARRLPEVVAGHLEGYRGAAPVRVGNAASEQRQLDVYGELVELAWRWHERGHVPDDDYWEFLGDVVDAAAEHWQQPDRGLWEIRGQPRHFVHSKAMCWAALDRGIALAEAAGRAAPVERWQSTRDEIRRTIERDGYDSRRGIFVQTFGSDRLDSALLLLPGFGFLAWDDERMVRTVDAIRDELDVDGLLLRYHPHRELQRRKAAGEGTFLACTFWLAECLARQGRAAEAREVFDRAAGCANDVGLFSEEYDPQAREMLGNFPQGLTHLAHIGAAAALAQCATAVTTRDAESAHQPLAEQREQHADRQR
jgi:GH15 family glucan-1,4-alpha-glucosidase